MQKVTIKSKYRRPVEIFFQPPAAQLAGFLLPLPHNNTPTDIKETNHSPTKKLDQEEEEEEEEAKKPTAKRRVFRDLLHLGF